MIQLAPRSRKVPEVTTLFWIIKILTTAMGEVLSDLIVTKINPVVGVLLGFIVFVIALGIQFAAKSYTPWKYWLTVSMVAVFGTMVADVIHIVLGVPYVISTIVFSILLAGVFSVWYVKEKTLSIHSITTVRREVFYWLAVVTTFALGTAAGDMTASTFALGYLDSGILFLAIIAVPLILYLTTKKAEVFFFWFAYIITRPLGASFADWFSKPISASGLGYGDGIISFILIVMIAGLVFYISKSPKEKHREGLN